MEVWRGFVGSQYHGGLPRRLADSSSARLGCSAQSCGGTEQSAANASSPLLPPAESAAEESPMSADSAAGIDASIAANIRGDAVNL